MVVPLLRFRRMDRASVELTRVRVSHPLASSDSIIVLLGVAVQIGMGEIGMGEIGMGEVGMGEVGVEGIGMGDLWDVEADMMFTGS
jgi:hypothetical protein